MMMTPPPYAGTAGYDANAMNRQNVSNFAGAPNSAAGTPPAPNSSYLPPSTNPQGGMPGTPSPGVAAAWMPSGDMSAGGVMPPNPMANPNALAQMHPEVQNMLRALAGGGR